MQLSVTENQLKRNIRMSWYQLRFYKKRKDYCYIKIQFMLGFFMQQRYDMKLKRLAYLEKAAAETRVMEIQNALKIIESDISYSRKPAAILLNDTTGLSFDPAGLMKGFENLAGFCT